ncbi:MAG: hypothetical protein GXP51_01560 [Deltaproteobacteria bacterium]|nr:hypothetical protein [Deltaproteobacteria bacterium]
MFYFLKGPKRVLLSATILTCLLFTTSAYAGNNLSLWNDTSIVFTDLSGPGQSSSSMTEGIRHYSVLDLKSRGKLDSYDYSFGIGFKATDDKRRDSKKFSLTSLSGRLSNRVHTFNIGDTYESFSKYSLNTAIKGASYHYLNNANQIPEITLLGGIAYTRWDNFWDTDATERKLYAARIKQDLTADLWLAASAVVIKDNRRNFGSPLYDGNTLSFDLEYRPLPGLTIVGESSFSHIDEDNLTSGTIKHNGQAYRLEAIGDQNPSRVVLEYERVDPDYLSIAGSATADREKFKASWRYKYTRRLTVTTAFLWYRDNLDGQLAVRTQHYKPEISFRLQRMFNRRYAVGTLGYKMDRSYSSAASTQNHFINVSYRDRFGIFDSTTNLGMTYYETRTVRKNDEFVANTSLSTRMTKGAIIWKPTIYLGTWHSDNELNDEVDHSYEYSVGLGCDIPSKKITSQLKVGKHKLFKESADDAERFYASLNVYYRPRLFARLKNSTLYLRGLINDYDYTTDSRDFRENRITVGFSVRF